MKTLLFTVLMALVSCAVAQDREAAALHILSGKPIGPDNSFLDSDGDGIRDGTTAGIPIGNVRAIVARADVVALADSKYSPRGQAAENAKAAPANKRLALRKLKEQWGALGYAWPPKDGELVGVVAAKLADVAALMDGGKTKEGVKLLAGCTAALALYNYCGAELALTADVPED